MRATESDPRVTELYNESTPFLDAYPDYDLALLPTWVRENIEAARVYGGSKRGVVLPDGRKYHLDNKLNDLTGREWTFFINSVFSTHYPTRGEEAYAHHIILDSGSITDVLNSRDAFFDYIFETENH